MQELKRQVISNRILLKPGFMDFDRSKSQHITSQQFLRVLKNLALMPPSEEVFDLITRKYCDRGTTNEVNYYKFCRDVDRPEDMFPGYVPKKPQPEPVNTLGIAPKQVSTFFKEPTKEVNVVANRFMHQRVDISNDPLDVEDRIRAIVVMKRIRIEEFFRDFDKLRKGRVTRNQFKSILSSMNFTLTDDEFEALADKYRTNDPEVFFNYNAFCDNINLAFTVKGIDKAPTTQVKPVTKNDTLLARRKYLQEQESPFNIEEILNEYRFAVNTRRILLKPLFQDFDITKNGHVTKAQFLRVLDLLKINAPEHITQFVLRRYMDKGNVDEVNYVDFCEDIDNSDSLFGVGRDFNHSFSYFPKTQARQSGAEVIRNQPDDCDDVLARIRAMCQQQRIRIGEFFRDFDKLRSGYITAAQFRIGLNMAKCSISAPEFTMLCENFQAPKEGDHIRWRDFCDAVDEVFTKKGLEKKIDEPLDVARTQTIYGRQQAQKDEKNIVQDVVDRFREVIRKHRLDAKSFFQDFDRHRHFKVSPKQFRQVLNTLGFPLSEEEVMKVALVYGNENNEIRYADFLADANCLVYNINGPTTGAKSTYVGRNTDFTGENEHNTLMRKIKNMIKKDRIRLTEFFQDHDTLRKGYLARQKFRSVLHSQKIYLTIEEFDRLENYFACSPNSDMVNYVNFTDEIDRIFTEKDLEKFPTKRINEFKAPSILDPKDVLNNDEEQVLHACLIRLGTDVKHRRLLIKPFFQDKDRSKSGFIAMSRFRSIFDNFKMKASDYEYELINRRFQAGAANEINYVEFDHVLRHYSGDHEP